MGKQTTAYQNAIECIAAELDWRRVAVEIAKTHPSVLVSAAKACGLRVGNEWEAEVRSMIPHDYIGAIKLCRTNTGWGLKEAKDWCDKYRNAA